MRRPYHYAKLFLSWISPDVFMTTYPFFCRYCVRKSNPLRTADELLYALLRRLKGNTRTILFLYDLPIEQAVAMGRFHLCDEKSYQLEHRILQCFDILCVFNRRTRTVISERYGIPSERFVEFELPDYGIAPSFRERRKIWEGKWRVMIAGNGERRYAGEWINQLEHVDNIRYEFLGPNWDWLSKTGRSDVTYRFLKSRQNLCDYMHVNADFGIIAYSESMSRYFEYACPSKFGAYVAAGLPILVSSDCTYPAHLAKKHGIGLVFYSYKQLPEMIGRLSESEYDIMRDRCLRLADKICNGFYLKRAVSESLHKLKTM